MPTPLTEALLQDQLSTTKATWERLVQHGLQPDSQVRIDFAFDAPSFSSGDLLLEFLRGQSDYDVQIVADEERWSVLGSTQPTELSLSTLEQWVEWMLLSGANFDCKFDGWGAEVP